VEPGAAEADAQDAPVELVQTLEQIRGVVRSALSALTSSDDAAANFFATSYASCLRLTELALEASALPPNAPQAAHRHLETLTQHISALRFLSKQMPASEISDVLINVHSTARHLARTLHLRVETKPAPDAGVTPAKEGRSSAS